MDEQQAPITAVYADGNPILFGGTHYSYAPRTLEPRTIEPTNQASKHKSTKWKVNANRPRVADNVWPWPRARPSQQYGHGN